MATANGGPKATGAGLPTAEVVEWLRERMDHGVVIVDTPNGLRWTDRRVPNLSSEMDEEIEGAVDQLVRSGTFGWRRLGNGWAALEEVTAA